MNRNILVIIIITVLLTQYQINAQRKPILGIQMEERFDKRSGQTTILIKKVIEAGSAFKAGVRKESFIIKVDNFVPNSIEQIQNYISKKKKDDIIKLELRVIHNNTPPDNEIFEVPLEPIPCLTEVIKQREKYLSEFNLEKLKKSKIKQMTGIGYKYKFGQLDNTGQIKVIEKYDTNGLLIYRNDNPESALGEQQSLYYDGNNNLIGGTTKKTNGNIDSISCLYDKANNCISISKFKNYHLVGKELFEYNDCNDIALHKTYDIEGNLIENNTNYECDYYSNYLKYQFGRNPNFENKVKEVFKNYQDNDNHFKPVKIDSITISTNDNHVYNQFYLNGDTAASNDKLYYYEYYDNGLIKEKSIVSYNEFYNLEKGVIYIFDNNENIILKYDFDKYNSTTIRYTNNEFNLPLKEICYDKSNEPLYEVDYSYEYY